MIEALMLIKGGQDNNLRGSIDQADTRNLRVHPLGWERMLPLCTNNQLDMVLWVEEHHHTVSSYSNIDKSTAPTVLKTSGISSQFSFYNICLWNRYLNH